MFEETLVCMTCGRPVEGQAYCSDECENLDIHSESQSSGVSSAYPSPYLHPMNAAGNLDVPALVPSRPGHRTRYSVSSSSNSSSVLTDEEEGDPYVYSTEDFGLEIEGMGTKSPGSLNGLSYIRKPSATNHRATVPTVHKHSVSSSSSFGQKGSIPSPYYAATEDDSSDIQSISLSDVPHEESERDSTISAAAAAKRRRNRASLPAYFSLLQTSSSSPSSTSARRSSASILTLNALSRSLHSSPTTPKIAYPTVNLISAEAHIDTTPRGRGRRREREPDARSASGRRATARSPPRHLSRPGLSSSQRARIDSVEKVTEWVSSSPLISIPGQHSRSRARRNSSPAAQRPRRESLAVALERALEACVIADEEEDQERTIERSERRGRRRAGELDEPMTQNAPGLGSGRSGLRARERERERGRPIRPVGL